MVARPPRLRRALRRKSAARRADEAAILHVIREDPPLAPAWRRAAKRVVDVIGACVGLLLSIPVICLLAPFIYLDSPGRVIFAQRRVGRRGRSFACYKLRTMRPEAEAELADDLALRECYEANNFKVPAGRDPRVTAFGQFLRVTSLDELPQFWNVLRGDMSLVGPRPIVPRELAHYADHEDTLLSVRPGVTGAWAVCGRSRIGYPDRATIELEYVRRWTIAEDVVIMARTVVAVLQRRGAY